MKTSLSPYIERGGDLVARHPFMQEKTHLRSFFLEAAPDKLQALCDKIFNRPTQNAFQFRPLANTVLLTFAQIEKIYSIHDQDQKFGYMSEIDVAFWVPMLSRRAGKLHLSWYVAYIFVDNPFAMASGREIYGFPKTMAQFQIPDDATSDEPYWVESMALPQFVAQEQARPLRLFELRRSHSQGATPQPVRPLDMARHLFSSMMGGQESLSTRWQLGWRYFHNLRQSQHVPVLFLRQLRDIQDPTCAAYQEIVEAPATAVRYHDGGILPGSFEVTFTPNASFPIADELGLCAEGHPVKAAVWVDFDFLMDRGQTIWRSDS